MTMRDVLRDAFMAGVESVRPDQDDPTRPDEIEAAWLAYVAEAAGGADDGES